MKKLISLFIFMGIVLLTASVAGAQTFTVLGTVTNNTDPAMFEPHQFDVTSFFPETTSATVSFDLKNDTPPLPGPGDNPNDLAFTSDPTTAEISVTKLTNEFQFRFQYVSGADTSHLRDVQLNLDGVVFRDQFAAFNNHLGSSSLGTARMGGGLAKNSLGQSGPVAQIFLLPFSLLQSVVSSFDFTANDLAQLSVDFSPCDAGACEIAALDEFSFDEFTFDLAACNRGACDAFFDTAESIFETAFECTGAACVQRDTTVYDPLALSSLGNIERLERLVARLQADQQQFIDWFGVPRDVPEGLQDLRDSENRFIQLDRSESLREAQIRESGLGPSEFERQNPPLFREQAPADQQGPPLSEAESQQQISAAFARDLEQYQQDQIQRDLYEALGIQTQIDMNNGIESVIPELAAIVVL